MVSDGFDEHRLTRTGGTVEEDTSRRIDTDLTVEVELSQGEFDGFSDLLLLNVHSSDIRVFTIGEEEIKLSCARVSVMKVELGLHIGTFVVREHRD